MRIKELRLLNYRVFDDKKFLFSDSFTVVAGINGQGKTALLDALALLSSRFLPLISPSRSPYRMIRPSELHRDADEARLSMKVNCAGFPIEYELFYTRESRKIKSTQLSEPLREEIRRAYFDPSRADDAAPIAVYYTTDRAGYRLPKKLPNEVPRGQAIAYTGALFNRIIDFKDFMARYRATIVLENEQRSENSCYLGASAAEAITSALQVFLDEFANLRVEEAPLRLVIDKGNVPLDLPQLSDGERSFLAVVCDLCRRLALANPLLANPLHGDGIVLIDELELHLHPTWQREIVEKLRHTFPNIQFIGTTHSPFIIQSLRPDELINLDPREFGQSLEYSDKSIEDIAESVMGVEVPQKSERFLQMMATAEEYFRLLRQEPQSEQAIAIAEERLNALSERFSDDPAFQALLKIEGKMKQGG